MDLGNVDFKGREVLAKKFIEEVVLPQWKQLQSWGSFTSQTAQIDFGYLGQHLASLLSGIPGKKSRGKGDDLNDGSEVKSASCLDSVDTPRWNNVNCGCRGVVDLKDRLSRIPFLFFVLLDTTEKGGDILRCRVWVVRPNMDTNFMNVMIKWANENDLLQKNGKKLMTNLQLHPPRWEKASSNITTNEMGNLALPLLYEAVQLPIQGILVMETKFFDPRVMQNGLSVSMARVSTQTKSVTIKVKRKRT